MYLAFVILCLVENSTLGPVGPVRGHRATLNKSARYMPEVLNR